MGDPELVSTPFDFDRPSLRGALFEVFHEPFRSVEVLVAEQGGVDFGDSVGGFRVRHGPVIRAAT